MPDPLRTIPPAAAAQRKLDEVLDHARRLRIVLRTALAIERTRREENDRELRAERHEGDDAK